MLFFLTLNLLLNIVHTYIRKLPDDSHIESKWANLVFPDNSIDKVKNLYEELSPSRWEYNVNCRLRFPSKPIVDNHYQKDRCLVDGVRKPAICFQEPIHYNYTWNPELATFPHQFAVIQRFPKCWSNLKNVFKHAGSKTKLIKAHDEGVTTDELWQVFPPDFCQNAAKDCSFLEDLKLWPSFLRCSDQVPVQLISTLPEGTQSADLKLFNPNCKVAYVQSPSEPEIYQCLWPLVYRRLDKAVSAQPKPLIDDCYMPCRSALLATRHTFDYFYFCAAVLCVVSFSIYGPSLFSIYFLLMFLPFLDFFFKTAICTSDGIRKEVGQAGFDFHGLQNFFDPCNLGGSQLLFSSICSSGWIFALLLNHLLFGSHQSVSDDKVRLYVTSTNVSSPTAISSRTLHSVLIYIMSAIYTLLVLLLSQVHMEPRLGICHYGTTNSHESLYLHLPTIVLLFVLFFVFVGLVVDKAKVKLPKHPKRQPCRRI
uniref:Uncharacterized protein n=1 Tax=Ditylenchus dipsaci TaxID=166011 RepID=A0A915EHQ8_9BILA